MAAVGRTGPRGRNGTLRPITARKRSGRSSAACVVDRRGPQPLCVLHETGLVAGRNIAVASSYCEDPAVPLERQHERSTAGPPRAREAEHALPVDGRIVGNREHGGRIGQVDADRRLVGWYPTQCTEKVERGHTAA